MRDLNVRTNLIAVGDKPAKLAKLTVTDNGTYTPTYPIEGYDEVEVEVPEPPPVILEDLNVTENGTYDPADYMADGFSEVTVDVPSGGPNEFYLIDPEIISTPSSVTDSSSGRLSKISPYAILWQETYNNFDYVNVNDEYFTRIHGSNSSRAFYTKIPKTAKRIEISGYNNQQSSFTYLTFYILAGPDPSPSGIYGGQYNCNILEDFHAAQYSGYSTEQLNSQLYFTRTGSGPKKIDDQVLIIDVEGMYQDGIITDDFWLGCSCCDIEFYCRYIKVVLDDGGHAQ